MKIFNKYNIIYDWTIIKLSENISYIIGLSELNNKIKSSRILIYNYIHNDFIMISTKNNRYKLYFEDQFKPTYIEKKLYDWKFINNNNSDTKSLLYNKKNFYITGKKYKNSNSLWETTQIVRKYKEGKNLICYTESGSVYILPLKYRGKKKTKINFDNILNNWISQLNGSDSFLTKQKTSSFTKQNNDYLPPKNKDNWIDYKYKELWTTNNELKFNSFKKKPFSLFSNNIVE